MHHQIEFFLFVASMLVLTSIIFSKASGKLGTPLLLVFLGIGILAGSEGLGGIYFDNPVVAQSVGIVALTLILFSGGLDSNWKDIKKIIYPGISLSTAGIIITAVLAGFFIKAVTSFTLVESFLVGAIISSTDAAAVFSILRANSVNIRTSLKDLLEFESGSNDPMAVFLTISLIQVIKTPEAPFLSFIGNFFLQMSVGAAAGYAFGKLSVIAVNRLKLEFEGLYPVLTLALVFLTFGMASLVGGNAFLAVYIAGIVIGNSKIIYKRVLLRFHDGLSWLMQITMFLTLGLLVFPTRITPIIVPGLMISLFLMFVARPLAVFISLIPFKINIREKLFLSWLGLRGAVPVILATFPMVAMIKQSDLIFNLVFFIVITSSLFQGTSVTWIAKLLKLNYTDGEKSENILHLSPDECIICRLIEIKISTKSPLAGKQILQSGLPENARVLLINRECKLMTAYGNTKLMENDVLLIAAEPSDFEKIKTIVEPIQNPE